MSEAVALSLSKYFGDRKGFRPFDLKSSAPGVIPQGEDPYARGLADGQEIAEASFSIERKQLHALIASANALRPEDSAEASFMLNNIIQSLVTKIVGMVPVDAAFLIKQIDAATAVLSEADQNRILRMHPEDLALLSGADLPLATAADSSLPRGALRIECSDGWIEHGPSFALERMAQALGDNGDVA
jgi:flagellar assembly protein FliH